MRVAGGGARSALWRQILADVLGVELATVTTTEGAAYGAALLAGVGAGTWASVASACDATIRPGAATVPKRALGRSLRADLRPVHRAVPGAARNQHRIEHAGQQCYALKRQYRASTMPYIARTPREPRQRRPPLRPGHADGAIAAPQRGAQRDGQPGARGCAGLSYAWHAGDTHRRAASGLRGTVRARDGPRRPPGRASRGRSRGRSGAARWR
ncbi:MAG: FGGY-family carbohydrate kinase [Chloroflexia bacterium]